MKKLWFAVLAVLCLSALIAVAVEKEKAHLRARLVGLEEVNPTTVITNGTGSFRATFNDDSTITYTLSYQNLSTPVVQAHIHIGATKINGGVVLFLCGPAGSSAHSTCPNDATNSGTVSGTLTADDVLAATANGIAAKDMANVARAIASRAAYANVHTTAHPAGEIRGQVRQFPDDEDDELPGAH